MSVVIDSQNVEAVFLHPMLVRVEKMIAIEDNPTDSYGFCQENSFSKICLSTRINGLKIDEPDAFRAQTITIAGGQLQAAMIGSPPGLAMPG